MNGWLHLNIWIYLSIKLQDSLVESKSLKLPLLLTYRITAQ